MCSPNSPYRKKIGHEGIRQGISESHWKKRQSPARALPLYRFRGRHHRRGFHLRKIDWTLFEDQSKAPCDANLIGTITTDDGATIEFEALGFFQQDGDSKMYTLTSGIRFPTDDGRYSNLRENLGLMTGKGDVEVFEMKHRIFLSE